MTEQETEETKLTTKQQLQAQTHMQINSNTKQQTVNAHTLTHKSQINKKQREQQTKAKQKTTNDTILKNKQQKTTNNQWHK